MCFGGEGYFLVIAWGIGSYQCGITWELGVIHDPALLHGGRRGNPVGKGFVISGFYSFVVLCYEVLYISLVMANDKPWDS